MMHDTTNSVIEVCYTNIITKLHRILLVLGFRWPLLLRFFIKKRMLIQIAGGDPLDGRGWPSKPPRSLD